MNKTLLATMIGLAVLTGCERSDNKNFIDEGVEVEAFNSPYAIDFQGLGAGVIEEDVPFELKSADGELNYLDITNAEEVTNPATRSTLVEKKYVTKTGGFIISRTANSSPDPIVLELLVTIPDYFTTSQTITIPASSDVLEEGAGFEVVIVTPLELDVDDVGVTSQEATGRSNDSGAVTKAIEVSTPVPGDDAANAQAVAGGKVDLTVPVSTVVLDRDDKAVTGPLTANVVYYSNEPDGTGSLDIDSALLAFPGGLSPTEIIGEGSDEPDPAYNDSTFVSAGFTAIQIQNDKGDIVSKFVPSVELSFQVSENTIAPEGEVIEVGNTIPVWSYSGDKGRWKAEGEAKVVAYNDVSKMYTVTKEISHLSYYNLDYLLSDNCNIDMTIQDADGQNYATSLLMVRGGGGWNKRKYISGFGAHKFLRVPVEGEGTLAITRSFGAKLTSLITSASVNGTDIDINDDGTLTYKFCDLDGGTITIGSDAPVSVDYSVKLQTFCWDGSKQVIQKNVPGFVQIYRMIGDDRFSVAKFNVGAGIPYSLFLEPGDYKVNGILRGNPVGDQEASNSITIVKDTPLDDSLLFYAGNSQCSTTGGTGGSGSGGASGGGTGN